MVDLGFTFLSNFQVPAVLQQGKGGFNSPASSHPLPCGWLECPLQDPGKASGLSGKDALCDMSALALEWGQRWYL